MDLASPGLPTGPSQHALRAQLIEMARRELLGPQEGPEEEFDEGGTRVSVRYLVGCLAPRIKAKSKASQMGDTDTTASAAAGSASQEGIEFEADEVESGQPESLESAALDSQEDAGAEKAPSLAGSMFPSSCGLSFCVDGAVSELRVSAAWGRYARTESDHLQKESGDAKLVWKRSPVLGSTVLKLTDGDLPPWSPSDKYPDVTVQGRARRSAAGDWVVTLFLVNGQTEPQKNKDSAWLFQSKLTVGGLGGAAVFEKRMSARQVADRAPASIREELQELAMLYRRSVEFARGHGVAVHATVAPGDSQRAVKIETEWLPQHEVPLTETPTAADNPDLAGVVLDMQTLAEADTGALTTLLRQLSLAYGKWIEREALKIDDPAEGLQEHSAAARLNIEKCRRALSRIEAGIAVLARDEQAADAFRFANKVMWQQRVRGQWIKAQQQDAKAALADSDIPKNRSWRAFQLAFILLCLESMADPQHVDRSDQERALCDVLWFPTGGGKTEAYLGLAAFAMALRRLRGEQGGLRGDDGVCVLMRYTLRLLTIQQFQRATALICACEVERRSDASNKWGSEPFRIGLWVGGKSTPNYTEQAAQWVREKKSSGWPSPELGSPAQLTNCPWCGQEIDSGKHIKVYERGKDIGRTAIYCGDPLGHCEFSEKNSPGEGLPALVVDEEIYRHPPSLVIATVDKFAQMPWNGQVQMLFGRVNGRCARHGYTSPDSDQCNSHPASGKLEATKRTACKPLRPPELIIQDELHLINGPLGSMVGLYETAIDELCSWELDDQRVRPKVIASSATIRRAKEQVRRLYLRDVAVFPPQGTDIRDNFFAVQREPSEQKFGRVYLGVCAGGKRLPAALISVYAALMAGAQRLFESSGDKADPWMTTVGYFNSMREMGGTRRLVEDDVSQRLKRMDERGLARRGGYLEIKELTSRVSSDAIPKTLALLENHFVYGKTRAELGAKSPVDVVLATNMISVGVDVPRLGLMITAGQPKTTSEYIQATSRVGRSAPGIVCTVFNWYRPRDLSHFESFEHYHSTFYSHVEALSVTPFAPRALDRGLAAVLAALVRLPGFELSANAFAGKLKLDSPELARARERIEARVKRIMSAEPDLLGELHRMLAAKAEHWLEQAEEVGTPAFEYRNNKEAMHLLDYPQTGDWQEFTCLNSLREVEPTVNLLLLPPAELSGAVAGTTSADVLSQEGDDD